MVDNKCSNNGSELDVTGLCCPEPIFCLSKFMKTLKPGEIFKVKADDPAAEEDIKRWAKRTKTIVIKFSKEDNIISYILQKT